MPLQIRRGTTAERLSITPLVGEPVFDTTLGQIFVGDGTTAGGTSPNIDSQTIEQALDTVGAALVNGVHQNISFVYGTAQDAANRIDATVSISALLEDLDLNSFNIIGAGNINITGQITSDITGSIFSDNSTMLVDGTNGRIVGPVFANVTGNVLGNLAGNVVGNVTGNVLGNLTGDVTGSVFSDNSTMLVDGTNGRIVAPVFGNIFTNLIDSADSSAILVATAMTFASDIDVENEIKSKTITNTGSITTANLLSSNINCLRIANPTTPILEIGIDDNNVFVENIVRVNKSSGVALAINSAIDTNEVADFRFIKSRGTFQSRIAVQSGDKTLEISSGAFNGTAISEVGGIELLTDGASPTSGQYPGKFKVRVGNNSGSTVEFNFDSKGIFTINDILKLPLLAAAPIDPAAGMIAIADRVSWDPASKGSGPSYPVYYNGTGWDSLT